MLNIITSIVIAVGGIQAAMVLPESERLVAEDTRAPVVQVTATDSTTEGITLAP
jgi:hypothetical protein